MDMTMENRRATPRVHAQFRTAISSHTKTKWMGRMLDLSKGGCRLESSLTMERGQWFELEVYVPDLECPLTIESAHVQWANWPVVGLVFFRIQQTEQQRLDTVIADLRVHGYEDYAH